MRFGNREGRATRTASLGVALLFACLAGHAQSTASSSAAANLPLPNGTGRLDPSMGTRSDQGYEEPQSFRVMRQKARRDEIKKQMEANATRLLRLTAELRNDLLTREPTEADGKRLDDIAKLAHAVREQMKQ